MRVLTFRLMQFAVCSLCLTVAFHYALNLSLGKGSVLLPVLCAVAYFCLMFIAGLYFGSKDSSENEIHDIGFRYHLVTYLLCIGIGCRIIYRLVRSVSQINECNYAFMGCRPVYTFPFLRSPMEEYN